MGMNYNNKSTDGEGAVFLHGDSNEAILERLNNFNNENVLRAIASTSKTIGEPIGGYNG